VLYDQGLAANDKRDGYALTTVLLASVLFFVGMSQRMKSNTLRATMVIVGALVFLVAVTRVSTLMLG
jgi:hypothetical protein